MKKIDQGKAEPEKITKVVARVEAEPSECLTTTKCF